MRWDLRNIGHAATLLGVVRKLCRLKIGNFFIPSLPPLLVVFIIK